MNTDTQKAKDNGPRVITIRMRLPVFITVMVLFVAGLAWIFFMGTLAGRGYNSREESGPLAAIVPAPKQPEQAAGKPAEPASGTEIAGINDLFKGDGLVPTEELDFKDDLREPAETGSAGSVNAPRNGQAGQTGQARPGTDGIAGPAPASGQAAQPSGQNTAQTAQPPAAGPLFEYIYQVSSFNQLHQAQGLTQKLNAGGVAAQIEQYKTTTTTWYRVLVTFKGKESELSAFLQELKKFNLNSPMLRKKKAVAA